MNLITAISQKYEIVAWAPKLVQQKYWAELRTAFFSTQEKLTKEEAIKLAQEMGISWADIADMSNHEGYYKFEDPTFLLRQIRNSGKF